MHWLNVLFFIQCTHATFTEMLSAGITTVGEFHYLHHGKKRFSLDQIILNAAQDAGIRIVLISGDLLIY